MTMVQKIHVGFPNYPKETLDMMAEDAVGKVYNSDGQAVGLVTSAKALHDSSTIELELEMI